MKKYLKTMILTSFLTLLPIVAGLILWNQLPEQMPTHWGMDGQVNGWSGKAFGVFGLPLILLAVHWLCALATFYADPKKQNHTEKILHLVLWVTPVLSLLLHSFAYAAALGVAVDMNMMMPIFLGLLFTVIGNYLPKCKQNYTIGIKIPWTLDSEENWNKTHRFAGILWVIGGLTVLGLGFFGAVWVYIPIMIAMTIVPVVYSFLLYRKGI